ncbi:MAG TPA: hypothetical protein VFP12_10900 [Allosphingosinicella sp.]|nr:hypothetical protein [Allosphingosinicella sp.]
MKWITTVSIACLAVCAKAQPFHDPIPEEFRGTFAPTLAECRNEDGVEVIEIGQDGVHYYEGDDYLIIGVKFGGSSTKSGKFVPLFNGRFTSRMETQLLGEVSARMEMETPNTLIRYALKDDGEVNSKPANTWIRCPNKPTVK